MLVSAAIELFAAAVGRHVALWRTVPLPHGHDGRILVLLLILAGSVALVALALRGSAAPLVLNVEGGGSLRLPPDTLERFLADELATDPDVVSTRAWFALREGRLAARFSVAVRPLASVPALRERLAAKAVIALRDELGLEADVADPAVKVLRVRELPRYLRS